MNKVLIVTTTGGFLPQFLKNDVEVLEELGFQINYASNFNHVVYEFSERKLEEKGILIHPIAIEKKPWHVMANIRAIGQLLVIIKVHGIDIVHCHNPLGGVVGRIAGMLSCRHPAIVYTAHGFHFFKGAPLRNWLIYYPVEKWLARHTDALITINSEDYTAAQRFRLRKGGAAVRIPGVGLDVNRFRPRAEYGRDMRRRLGIKEEKFHLLTAAEINGNKNYIVVLKALERLSDLPVCYSICGRGELRGELEKYVAEHDLSDRVKFLGYRYDMEMVLQSADAFVFPSKREGLGMAALEAMASGIPVIATDNRGTREYVSEDTGYLCPPDDPDAFAAAIRDLFSSPDKKIKMGRRAAEAAKKFSSDKTIEAMRSAYEQVIKSRGFGDNGGVSGKSE